MHTQERHWKLAQLLGVLLIPVGIICIEIGELWLLSMSYSTFLIQHADFWKLAVVVGTLLLAVAYWTHRDALDESSEQ